MLNKKILSEFLRKERISVIASVILGLTITVGSQPDKSVSTVTEVPAESAELTNVTAEVSVESTELANVTPLKIDFSKLAREEVVTEEITSFKQEEIAYEEEIYEEETTLDNVKTEVFEITAYCSCKSCCGQWSPEVTGKSSITSTGVVPKQGRTIAVDPKVIPYGTVVYINGNEYIAEDCGGAIKGKRIDMYFDSHEEALNWGRQRLEVTYSK